VFESYLRATGTLFVGNVCIDGRELRQIAQ
jgi:hypothetical protein